MPDQLALDEHAVETVLGADHHLLQQHGVQVAGRIGVQPGFELGVAVEAERRAGSGAGGRFGDERITELRSR